MKAKPDGYTLQMGAVGANVTPAAVQKDYPFDPLRDYVPVAMVAEWSAILVVKKDLPVNTLAEFVAYAKARPGALNFGTTGFGSFAHLVSEVFMQQTGIAMQHVQYKGGAPATNDLMAGAIDAHMMSSAVGAGPGRKSEAEDAGGREQAAAAVDPEGADHGGGGRAGRRSDLVALRVRAARRAGRGARADRARGRRDRAGAGLPGEIPRHRIRAARPRRAGDRADVPRRGHALERVHQGARADGEGESRAPRKPEPAFRRVGMRSLMRNTVMAARSNAVLSALASA